MFETTNHYILDPANCRSPRVLWKVLLRVCIAVLRLGLVLRP